jgi:hypothetical protein
VCVALLLAVAGGLPVAPAAQPEPSGGDLAELMSLLAQRRHGHAAYVEEHFMHALTRPLKSEGELVYDAPAHLEKRTVTPRPETLVVDNGTMTAQRGRHTYVLTLSEHPEVVPLVDSIRATLAGDLPGLERLFSVQWQGTLDQWHLTLAPRSADMSRSVKQIDIRGERNRIRSLEIWQTDGDRSLMTLGPEISD